MHLDLPDAAVFLGEQKDAAPAQRSQINYSNRTTAFRPTVLATAICRACPTKVVESDERCSSTLAKEDIEHPDADDQPRRRANKKGLDTFDSNRLPVQGGGAGKQPNQA